MELKIVFEIYEQILELRKNEVSREIDKKLKQMEREARRFTKEDNGRIANIQEQIDVLDDEWLFYKHELEKLNAFQEIHSSNINWRNL